MMTYPWRLSFRPSRGSAVPGCVGSSRSRAHRRIIACNMNEYIYFRTLRPHGAVRRARRRDERLNLARARARASEIRLLSRSVICTTSRPLTARTVIVARTSRRTRINNARGDVFQRSVAHGADVFDVDDVVFRAEGVPRHQGAPIVIHRRRGAELAVRPARIPS